MSLARANVGFHWKLFLSAISVLALSGCLIYVAVGISAANLRSISAFNRTLVDVDFYVRSTNPRSNEALQEFIDIAPNINAITRAAALPRPTPTSFYVEDGELSKRVFITSLDTADDALMVPSFISIEARRALSVPGAILLANNVMEKHQLSIGDTLWNESRDFGLEIIGTFESSFNRDFVGQSSGHALSSQESMELFSQRSPSFGRLMTGPNVVGIEHREDLTFAEARAYIDLSLRGKPIELVDTEQFHRREIFKSILENKQVQGFLFIAAFSVLIPLLIIVQTLRTAILSQSQQFATLRALGVPSRHLISTAMEQALWVGVIGVAASYCLMLGVQIGLKPYEIDMYVDRELLINVSVAIMAAALLAGFFSIFALYKMKPQDLLR